MTCPALHDFAYDVGPLLDESPDQKESRPRIVPRQHFQQSQRVRIVWSIIVGECDLPGSLRQANERAPEPLPGRRHRLVARRSQQCRGTRACKFSKHAAILADGWSFLMFTRRGFLHVGPEV